MDGSLVSVVVGCTDEDVAHTRESALKVLQMWFALTPAVFSAEAIKTIYPELLKRLDDAQDTIRLLTVSVLTTMLKQGGPCPPNLDNVHYELLCKTITIHLDDPNPDLAVSPI
jgi:dynein assembly factor 5